jgi:hypothetical protein
VKSETKKSENTYLATLRTKAKAIILKLIYNMENLKNKTGFSFLIDTIAKSNQREEKLQKNCIHSITPNEVYRLAMSAGLKETDISDFVGVCLTVARGLLDNGTAGLQSANRGEFIVSLEALRSKQL